jgi:RNA polymerase sigma-70 factor (sigma-E family)
MGSNVVEAVRHSVGPAGFGTLYAAHNRELVRFAYLLTGDPDQAQDVVADVFTKVLRRWGRTTIEQPQAYLRRAVVNTVNSGLRRRYLRRRIEGTADGSDRGVLHVGEELALRDEVFRALERLPERQRTTVVLRFYEDLSVAETAAVLQVSEGTVKSQTSRALERLNTILSGPTAGSTEEVVR